MKFGYGVEFGRGSRHRKVRKDIKRRSNFRKLELNFLFFKFLRAEGIFNYSGSAQRFLLGKYSSTRIRNRCVYTGKSRGVLSRYKMSRISFRELCLNGGIPGFRKSSW